MIWIAMIAALTFCLSFAVGKYIIAPTHAEAGITHTNLTTRLARKQYITLTILTRPNNMIIHYSKLDNALVGYYKVRGRKQMYLWYQNNIFYQLHHGCWQTGTTPQSSTAIMGRSLHPLSTTEQSASISYQTKKERGTIYLGADTLPSSWEINDRIVAKYQYPDSFVLPPRPTKLCH